MRMGVLLDSAAGRDLLLTQISSALVASYQEMSRLRTEWLEELGIDRAQLIDHLGEHHRRPSEESAVGILAQLDCELTQFRERYQAAATGTDPRLWDAAIVTYANARLSALRLGAFSGAVNAS